MAVFWEYFDTREISFLCSVCIWWYGSAGGYGGGGGGSGGTGDDFENGCAGEGL